MDWKTGKVTVKMPVMLKMRVLISVHSLQTLREDSKKEREAERKKREKGEWGERLFAKDNKPLMKG